VEGASAVKKDYPLFLLVSERTFYREMERRGFRKLEAEVTLRGDSYSVLWETPQGDRRLTPREDEGNLESFILSAGIVRSEEDPDKRRLS